jgi:hypothetical protein
MAIQTITYEDKQYINQNADIPATNKVQDTDMNEIKSVVNNNANEFAENINLQETYATNSYAGVAIAGSANAFNGFNIFNSYGNLTTSSNGITIGSGINGILVSGLVGLQNASSNYNLVNAGLMKNGTIIESALTELRNSNGTQSYVTLPAIIIPVQEGDVIAIYGNGEQTTSIRRAYLNVKAIF